MKKIIIQIPLVPDCLVPNWAELYGIKTSAMQRHITGYNPSDRLPRGMGKQIPRMRQEIMLALRGGSAK